MKSYAKNKPYKRIAVVLSMCALMIWGILGTGTSLAWFVDTSPKIHNIFHFADFKLEVYHRLTDGSWEKVDSQTTIFDEEALYEPGYVQVVYLKVENKGALPFEFFTGVNINGYTEATNVFEQSVVLQDYLKFGVMVSDSEEDMKNSIANRRAAVRIADKPLENYSANTAMLTPNTSKYIALIVRMPEEVDNIINYRGDVVPKVELGITVKAEQIRNGHVEGKSVKGGR